MATGKRVSLYVSSGVMTEYHYLEKLAKERDTSVSELICRCIEAGVPQLCYGYGVSEYAHAAIAEGNFEDLTLLTMSDKQSGVMVKQDVRKPEDGSKCKYTDRVSAMQDAIRSADKQ